MKARRVRGASALSAPTRSPGARSSVSSSESSVAPVMVAVTSRSLPLAPSPARRVGSSARSNQTAICVANDAPVGRRLIQTSARFELKL